MIQLEALEKSFGGQALFTGIDWFVPVGERIGLVGPNGAGKTTLFRIITGEEHADSGRVLRHGDRRVGYLAQEIDVHTSHTVLEEVIAGRPRVLDIEREMQALRERMERASPEDATALSARYGELEAEFTVLDGYALRPMAERILSGMGFSTEAVHRPLDTFSGGWQMRAMLSRLLLSAPDLLLLDEPTNHLDLPSVEWLEGFLRDYAGTVIIISHDRYFLNRMVTQIAELSHGQLTLWAGNYDEYQRRKAERAEQLGKAASQQQKEIEKIESFVRRFRSKATKAKQVQSRVKALEKMDRVDLGPGANKTIHFNFPQPPRSGRDVLGIEGLAKAYGDNVVYDGVDFSLSRGEKVVLVGPNGAGKSTLLKILAGASTMDAGEMMFGHNVSVSYFAQHAVDALELNRTVLEEMQAAATDEAQSRVRSILGAFLFSGDTVNKKVSVLSGGEKNRLALAKLLLEPRNLLLLDEPTNHLDIQSCDVLEAALASFDGTICFISHDRHFINSVATRVVHVEDATLGNYPGDYEYYRYKRDEELEAKRAEQGGGASRAGSSRKELKRIRAELRKEKAELLGDVPKRLAHAESEVARLEAERERLEARLADPELYASASSDEIKRLNMRNAEIDGLLEGCYETWEELAAVVEEVEADFAEREAELVGAEQEG